MKFKAVVHDDGIHTQVTMSGTLDERCELPEFEQPVKGDLVLDLAGIVLVNSLGCRRWVQWNKMVKPGKKTILRRCSPAFVKQINILSGFIGKDTHIESIFVPYYCQSCGFEENKLVELTKLSANFQMPEVIEEYPCPKCAKSMEIDMVKSHYFHFLEEQRAKIDR